MAYHLKRVGDGAGDSGLMSKAIQWKLDGTEGKIVSVSPTIGCSMLVGGLIARTYSPQDYWLTTTVKEILAEFKTESSHYVRFKTENSEYEWWSGEYPTRG